MNDAGKLKLYRMYHELYEQVQRRQGVEETSRPAGDASAELRGERPPLDRPPLDRPPLDRPPLDLDKPIEDVFGPPRPVRTAEQLLGGLRDKQDAPELPPLTPSAVSQPPPLEVVSPLDAAVRPADAPAKVTGKGRGAWAAIVAWVREHWLSLSLFALTLVSLGLILVIARHTERKQREKRGSGGGHPPNRKRPPISPALQPDVRQELVATPRPRQPPPPQQRSARIAPVQGEMQRPSQQRSLSHLERTGSLSSGQAYEVAAREREESPFRQEALQAFTGVSTYASF